jgi:thioredoxin-dependent peroxiredoxin
VIGASADKIEDNQKFTDKESYTFAMWSDTELKLIKELGIEIAGRKLSQRVTFVVDREGKIAKIYDKVTPKDHAKEVLKDVKELDKKK